jgi:hypothetical protein
MVSFSFSKATVCYFLQSLHIMYVVYSSTEALMQSFDLHSLYSAVGQRLLEWKCPFQ